MDTQELLPIAQLFADAMNQLSFISAIIGGFAIALLAGVLGREKTALTQWTVGILATASMLQISCTIYFALASFRILTHAANRRHDDLDAFISGIDPALGPFVVAFLASFFLFFAGIAMTGWSFGRRTGYAATVVAILASLLALNGIRLVF